MCAHRLLKVILKSYLADIDAIVDRPRRLKALQHALRESLGQPMHADEVFEVFGSSVIERAPWVHPLDNGRHVTKDRGMHECWWETHNKKNISGDYWMNFNHDIRCVQNCVLSE